MKAIKRFALLALILAAFDCHQYGLVDKLENPGGSNQTGLLAFVASAPTLANLSGYTGANSAFMTCASFAGLKIADCACQVMATNAGLAMPPSGKYVAWLSTAANDMTCRITGATNPLINCPIPAGGPRWIDTQGSVIANGFAGLFSGTLMSPLNVTENKTTLMGNVWTGTNSNGTTASTVAAGATDCTGWTAAGSGTVGDLASTTTWSNNGIATTCTTTPTPTSLPIYCFAMP